MVRRVSVITCLAALAVVPVHGIRFRALPSASSVRVRAQSPAYATPCLHVLRSGPSHPSSGAWAAASPPRAGPCELSTSSQTPPAWQGGQSPGNRFALTDTDSADAFRFVRHVTRCAEQTGAFADLLSQVPESLPLSAVAADNPRQVLFGAAFDARSQAPVLTVDLSDLDRVPTAEQTRTWRPDSSWAWTRCEILAHELAEAIEYRRIWRQQSSTEESQPRFQFRDRIAQAHAYALERERAVAVTQGTRIDEHGTPHMRTGFCSRPEERVIHVVFGRHTQTLVLAAGRIARIDYRSNRDLCKGG